MSEFHHLIHLCVPGIGLRLTMLSVMSCGPSLDGPPCSCKNRKLKSMKSNLNVLFYIYDKRGLYGKLVQGLPVLFLNFSIALPH